MNKEFIPYQEALELKELGFDEPCFGAFIGKEFKFFDFSNDLNGYVNDKNLIIGAPTYSQAFRWFREKYRKVDYPEFDYDEQKWHCHSDYKGYVLFNTYEEAELECLKKLIQIVKENKQ
jgi:hypothetical protein